jgi:hypothetical protein
MVIASNVGGHPLWHLLIVAGGALATFAGIKVHEYRNARAARPLMTQAARPLAVSRGRAAMLAGCSLAVAAIHASVSGPHFREAITFGVFFAVAATLQAAWGLAVVRWPTRGMFWAAAIGNAAVLLTWAISRTVGLPFGPEPWRPETVGIADILAGVAELAIAIGTTQTLLRANRQTRPHLDAAAIQ